MAETFFPTQQVVCLGGGYELATPSCEFFATDIAPSEPRRYEKLVVADVRRQDGLTFLSFDRYNNQGGAKCKVWFGAEQFRPIEFWSVFVRLPVAESPCELLNHKKP